MELLLSYTVLPTPLTLEEARGLTASARPVPKPGAICDNRGVIARLRGLSPLGGGSGVGRRADDRGRGGRRFTTGRMGTRRPARRPGHSFSPSIRGPQTARANGVRRPAQ